MSVSELSPLVRSRRSLVDAGWTERAIEGAVREGALRVVRRGWYIEKADAAGLWPEAVHLAHVIAVARDQTGGAVASHESAAVLWGIPLYDYRPARVHMTVAAPMRVSSGADVLRHVAPLASMDVALRDGIRTTNLSRTIFDLLRTLRPEAAVAAADAAERLMAERGREWDEDAVACWRAGMDRRLEQASGARGIRQARRLAQFSNGKAQSPGESVSRLQVVRLGFPVPELQVPVPAPDGRMYFVDLGLRDARAFGEFDGKGKYLDESLRRGVSLEQVLLEEKQREDWVRGTTQWRFARWESSHIRTPRAVAARLTSFGIHPPG